VFEIGVLRKLEKMRNVKVHILFYTRVFQIHVLQVFPTKPLYAFLFSPYVPHTPTNFMPDLIALIVSSELKLVVPCTTDDENRLIVGIDVTTMKE
jgi:hypothetical protein